MPNQYTTGRCKANRDRYEIDEETGCWIWMGALISGRYGAIKVNGVTVLAHKYHYEKKYGLVPKRKELDHICDNSVCCNPDHVKPVPRRKNRIRSHEAKLMKRKWQEGVPF